MRATSWSGNGPTPDLPSGFLSVRISNLRFAPPAMPPLQTYSERPVVLLTVRPPSPPPSSWPCVPPPADIPQNDDGPPCDSSPNIFSFAKTLQARLGWDVRVVIPDSQKSWCVAPPLPRAWTPDSPPRTGSARRMRSATLSPQATSIPKVRPCSIGPRSLARASRPHRRRQPCPSPSQTRRVHGMGPPLWRELPLSRPPLNC